MAKLAHPSSRGRGSLVTYSVGFVASVVLTLEAYFFTTHHTFNGATLTATIVGLALIQLVAQLLFFLHLDSEVKPRWNLLIAIFTGIILLIVVGGSLWIMSNLDYHHGMSPSQIIKDEGVQP